MGWLAAWHFFVHWTGSDFGSDFGRFQPYDFLSGVAGLSVAGAVLGLLRKHNCHRRWCWRFGHHEWVDPVSGVAYQLCRKHHPAHPGRKQLTGSHIRAHARNQPPGEGHVPT